MLQSMAEWVTKVFIPLGGWGLFVVAFAESSVFPIPPDVLLIPLVVATPKLAVWYAGLCTAASVSGGVFGYFIGRRAGRKVLLRLTTEEKVAGVERLFRRWGGWAVGVAALTPIPYKVFTIAGGLFRVDGKAFILASVLGRGGRFFLEALLVQRYGRYALAFMSRNFELLTVGIVAAVILGYWLVILIGRKRRTVAAGAFSIGRYVLRMLGSFVDQRLNVWGEYAIYFLAGWVAFAMSMVIFGKVLEEVFFERDFAEDLAILKLVHVLVSPQLTRIMIVITALGSLQFVAVLAAALVIAFAVYRRYVDAATVAVLTAGGGSLIGLLKIALHRPRPEAFTPLVLEKGFSFPSGHSMVAVSLYGFLAYLLLRQGKGGIFRWGAGILMLLIGLVGLSRVYLGVHWPSDVLGGYVAGAGWLLPCILVSEELRLRMARGMKRS